MDEIENAFNDAVNTDDQRRLREYDEVAEFLNGESINRFNGETGDPMTLLERVKIFSEKNHVMSMLDGLRKSIEDSERRPRGGPFGPFGGNPFE